MSTVQKLLRDALVSKIQTALPAVTLFRAPRREIADTELPAICCLLYTSDAADE